MPRYYIDVRSRFGLDEDVDGLELPDLLAAHAQALAIASKLRERWSEIPSDARCYITIEIVDADLRRILTIPLTELEGRGTLQ